MSSIGDSSLQRACNSCMQQMLEMNELQDCHQSSCLKLALPSGGILVAVGPFASHLVGHIEAGWSRDIDSEREMSWACLWLNWI